MEKLHRGIPRLPYRRLNARLALGLGLSVLPAWAAEPVASPSAKPAATASAEPSLPVAAPRPPLSPLPKPPSLEVPPPDPAALEALDAHLLRLVSRDADVRETAAREVLEVERDALAAIHRRITTLAESSDHEAMKRLLGDTKGKARGAQPADDDEKDKRLDYIEMLNRYPKPDSKHWRDVVQVVAMGRMLRQIGTVEAGRELVGIYARFGEFMRLEMQRNLLELGERAIAALVEAERHPAKKIGSWASRQLDTLGKAIPGEAVQTGDPQVLADVLRAYGRARNPDAARLVISFTSSERTRIRDAARQAVVLLGEVGNWQLRDTYENVVGRKPPREWSWDRVARELFAEFDRLRLSEVYVSFERGREAQKGGKLDEMAAAYDQVLAQSPFFDRAPEMISGYLAYARGQLDEKPELATHALRRVLRLAPEGSAEKKTSESLLLTLDAERLFAGGVADATLARRALELDPANARAKALLDRMTRGEHDPGSKSRRYAGAGAVGGAALLAILFILLRKRAPPEPEPAVPHKDDEPPSE